MKWLTNFVADSFLSIGIGNGLFRPRAAYPYTFRNLDYEWQIGFPWYMQSVEGNEILDGGCVAHLEFDKILCNLGFRVYGVDIAPIPNFAHANYTFIQKTIWSTQLPEKSVDCVIANSLFEHLGLPCYNQRTTEYADKLALSEFHRVLKPRGVLLFQVPFGDSPKIIWNHKNPFYRVYTLDMVSEIVKPFDIEDKYYVLYERGGWTKVNELVASRVKVDKGLPPCLCFIKARKR